MKPPTLLVVTPQRDELQPLLESIRSHGHPIEPTFVGRVQEKEEKEEKVPPTF
jgi:hypothetical protein